MSNTTTTHRHDSVLDAVADLESLSAYSFNLVDVIDPGSSEAVKIPSFGSLTVNDVFATSVTAAAATDNELVISVNREKWTNNLIDARQEAQNINGNYLARLTEATMRDLRSKVEIDFLDHLGFGSGVSSGSATTFNVDAGALATTDWRAAHSYVMSQKGVSEQDLLFILDPYASNKVRDLGTFEIDKTIVGSNNIMGVRQVGVLDGVPVISSQGLPGSLNNRKSFSISTIVSGAVSSQYTTASIGADHGLLASMPIFTTDLSTDTTGSVAITSVTATTVIFPLTGSVTRPNPATLTLNACVNYLVSKRHVHFLPQSLFDFKFVDIPDKHAVAIQAKALYGRGARSGYVARILSPYASLSALALVG